VTGRVLGRDGPWIRVDPQIPVPNEPGLRCWQREAPGGHLMVLVAKALDPAFPRPLWHLSISHRTNTHPPQPGRYPDWDEITDARYRFVPDGVVMAMLLPPRAEYVNVHESTFQLWEIDHDYG
jgi:hypothetical protein